jgi:hypothetical protein
MVMKGGRVLAQIRGLCQVLLVTIVVVCSVLHGVKADLDRCTTMTVGKAAGKCKCLERFVIYT